MQKSGKATEHNQGLINSIGGQITIQFISAEAQRSTYILNVWDPTETDLCAYVHEYLVSIQVGDRWRDDENNTLPYFGYRDTMRFLQTLDDLVTLPTRPLASLWTDMIIIGARWNEDKLVELGTS